MESGSVVPFLVRNRLGTVDAIHAALAPDESPKEVERVIALLKRRGAITSHPLYGRKHYTLLSVTTCRSENVPEERALPLGPQGLKQQYAFLLYTTENKLKRLTREEMLRHENLKHLVHYGLDSHRYALGENHLTLMVADCGASTRHMKRKVIREWLRRKKHPEWQRLMDAGMFSVVTILAAEAKARRLRAMLRDTGVAFHTAVFPELAKLGGSEQ